MEVSCDECRRSTFVNSLTLNCSGVNVGESVVQAFAIPEALVNRWVETVENS